MTPARSADPPIALDACLLEACRRGERAALERVLGRELPSIQRLLRRLLGPGAHVDDVVQDTLEATVVAFPGYRGEAPVASWMARIAVRAAFRFLRAPATRRLDGLEGGESDLEDASQPPESVLESRRALAATYRHLDRLGPKKRIAFVLHVFEGRPIAEVAALMESTEVATKSRIFFARRELLARARRDPELRERTGDDRRDPGADHAENGDRR